MQVGMADAARFDADDDFAGTWLGLRDVFNYQQRAGLMEYGSFHCQLSALRPPVFGCRTPTALKRLCRPAVSNIAGGTLTRRWRATPSLRSGHALSGKGRGGSLPRGQRFVLNSLSPPPSRGRGRG